MSSTAQQMVIPVVEENGQMRAIMPEPYTFASGRLSDYRETPPVTTTGKPTRGIIPEEETAGYPWANWGIDDRLPTTIREKIQQVPMAGRAIYQLTQMMAGNGICYYRNADLESGPKVKRAKIGVVEDFLRRNRIDTAWLPAQLLDYRYYMNCFSEMAMRGDKEEITGIFHKPAEFCRLREQDLDTGVIEQLYYSPRFGAGMRPTNDQIAALPLYDWMEGEEWMDEFTGHNFAWHSHMPTPGILYYAMILWIGLFKDGGWMDVSSAVPGLINSLQHNQVRLKYHI
ncbi:MAG: hypothetical protein AAFQ01_01945, partial [Bacteroidota bacterium]